MRAGMQLPGVYAVHPITNESIPIYIADYVLTDYGEVCVPHFSQLMKTTTNWWKGAVMAVPAHDERDYEFAKQFHLPIKNVIKHEEAVWAHFDHSH